jgi:transcriptional regulator with PAS, ATPase and Fis domain
MTVVSLAPRGLGLALPVLDRAGSDALVEPRIVDLDGPVNGFEELIGSSKVFGRVLDAARRVAATDITVLIEGESGTGKELLAQGIHRHSRRAGPMIAVNCAAIPEGLLESELFGHERGAFTGAIRTRPGRFELARGGTLFLDEIGDMPLTMQAKILRALQDRKIERVGGTRSIDVDVRIIAATHQNLTRLVSEGKFRMDLFYRLQGVHLRLPALRDRIEDLRELIDVFLANARRRQGRGVLLSDEALQCLKAYDWPGNVRELQHVLEGAALLSDGVIRPDDLPPAIQRGEAPQSPRQLGESLDATIANIEREMIVQALRRSDGVQTRAARLLGIAEASLWYRIKKFGIEIPGRRPVPSAG